MLALYLWLKNWLDAEEGQDLIEYALIIVLIVIAAVVAFPPVANAIKTAFQNITGQLGS